MRENGKGFCSRSCSKSGVNHPGFGKTGESSFRWVGDKTSYAGAHRRVNRVRGKADHCSVCGATDPSLRYEWASLTHDYANPDDYAAMCKLCHRRFDAESWATGSKHHMAKLTEDIVRECRVRYAAGGITSVDLASEFSVSQSAMWSAIHGVTWKHVA
jgi:hypothetical protein